MKTQNLFPILALPFLLAPVVATAGGPAKSPTCAQKIRLNAPPGGSGVYFDADCKTAYVLPPVEGEISISSMAPTLHLRECPALESRYRTLQSISNRIDRLWQELNGEPDSSSRRRRPGSTLGSGRTIGGGAASEEGDSGSRLTSEEAIQKTKELNALYGEIKTILEPYLKIVGATAQINYSIRMSQLVQAYQERNPAIRFERMPFSVARMSFSPVEAPESAQIPGALSVKVPGLGSIRVDAGALSDPNAEGTETDADSGVVFGDSLSAQVILSLAGACPFYDNRTGRVSESVSPRDLAAYVNANVQYAYALEVYRSYKASYNLGSLVRKIREETASGGLFSSKTASKLIVEKDSDSWFRLLSSSDDPRFYYDSLAQELKADLMDRVVKQISYTQTGPSIDGVDAATPKPNGASVASNRLRKNCAHSYCQSGAAVLEIFNSVVGREEKMTAFIERNDFWANDDVSEKRMFHYYGSFGFGPRGRSGQSGGR